MRVERILKDSERGSVAVPPGNEPSAGQIIHPNRKTAHQQQAAAPQNISVEFDSTPSFTMALPTSGVFTGAELSQDLRAALAKVGQ